jgi:hypothetical protein
LFQKGLKRVLAEKQCWLEQRQECSGSGPRAARLKSGAIYRKN